MVHNMQLQALTTYFGGIAAAKCNTDLGLLKGQTFFGWEDVENIGLDG